MEYVVSFLTAVLNKKKFKSCEELKTFIRASKHLLSNEKQRTAHSRVSNLLELAMNRCLMLSSFSSSVDRKATKKRIKIANRNSKPKPKMKKHSRSNEK